MLTPTARRNGPARPGRARGARRQSRRASELRRQRCAGQRSWPYAAQHSVLRISLASTPGLRPGAQASALLQPVERALRALLGRAPALALATSTVATVEPLASAHALARWLGLMPR